MVMLGVGECFLYTNWYPTGLASNESRKACDRICARDFIVESNRPNESSSAAISTILNAEEIGCSPVVEGDNVLYIVSWTSPSSLKTTCRCQVFSVSTSITSFNT